MNRFKQVSSRIVTVFNSRQIRVAIMVLTIALFVLSAGAPNATGAIGK